VVDKSGIASGASGIACGVIRNNYFQPAMRRLMATASPSGERPKAFQLPPGRLHADQPGSDARGRSPRSRSSKGRSATNRSSSRVRRTRWPI